MDAATHFVLGPKIERARYSFARQQMDIAPLSRIGGPFGLVKGKDNRTLGGRRELRLGAVFHDQTRAFDQRSATDRHGTF
jgi:hypothetical protein